MHTFVLTIEGSSVRTCVQTEISLLKNLLVVYRYIDLISVFRKFSKNQVNLYARFVCIVLYTS